MNKCELIYPSSEKDPHFLHASDLSVVYANGNNRKISKGLEKLIQAKKDEILRFNQNIYPAKKFRLNKVIRRMRPLIEFQIGLTDYVDYLATNNDPKINKTLVRSGILKYHNPDAYLSNAIGNLAIVSTLDRKMILLKRSAHVATFQGFYDCPGGHPEPDNVQGPFNSENIVQELFSSISREITEELAIDSVHLVNISLIGIIRNCDDGRKPEMIFYTPISLTAEELTNKYTVEGTDNLLESDQILLISPQDALVSSILLTIPTRIAINLVMKLGL